MLRHEVMPEQNAYLGLQALDRSPRDLKARTEAVEMGRWLLCCMRRNRLQYRSPLFQRRATISWTDHQHQELQFSCKKRVPSNSHRGTTLHCGKGSIPGRLASTFFHATKLAVNLSVSRALRSTCIANRPCAEGKLIYSDSGRLKSHRL